MIQYLIVDNADGTMRVVKISGSLQIASYTIGAETKDVDRLLEALVINPANKAYGDNTE